MSPHNRRAAARRRAWGRGPMILRFEPLEGRQLLSAGPHARPDLVATSFDTLHNLDWGDSFHAVGTIRNQGGATTTAPFKVVVYASPGPAITKAAIPVGVVEIPAGLAPGASAQFDQVMTMPGSPLPATDQTQNLFLDLNVNPDRAVQESNYRNNVQQGQGLDTSIVQITPHVPAHLVGTALGISPNSVQWGQTINLTAQVTNNAQGNAPPTRARLVLTPNGLTPGGPFDVTIDSLAIPAVPAWQTVNISHQFTLPATPPSSLAGSSQFVLSMIQDADFQTNTALSSQVAQGLGFDQAQLSITPLPGASNSNKSLPDLAATTVLVPATTLDWGQSTQVSTTVQNLGQADAGPFRVRFLLTGQNGALTNAIFLADATLPGLKAGYSQEVTQTVRIPSRLPNGMLVNGSGPGRILVMVDPENTVDESLETNNVSTSAPIQLRLLGTDGTTTVPTLPASNPTLNSANATGSTNTQVHPLGNPNPSGNVVPGGRPLNTRLNTKKDHGLKAFPRKVGHELSKFFKNVGHKLSISGGSRSTH